jgi:hypothetical protein
VLDVWDSLDAFDRFGRTLVPILAEVGIDAGPPEVVPVRYSATGAVPAAAAT